MQKFSIVMASKLDMFTGAATMRIEKFLRAVDSVSSQVYPAWELLIIADNCQLTVETDRKSVV